jgi:quercetin 2,3-dioxygenase
MENIVFHPADTRGHVNHGWLDTHHTFSFASYHDPSRVHFGELRVINDDIVAGGYGFGKHPHDNMEIITVVLDGALEHQDSMGHKEAIQTNEVQVMSASEYNHNKDKAVSLFQIWIFPDKANVTPSYDQRLFSPEDRINKLQTLVSPMDNSDEGLKIHQHAWIYRATLEEGKTLTHHLHGKDQGVYILSVDGTFNVNDKTLNKRDGIGINGTDEITITADTKSDILLLEVPMNR